MLPKADCLRILLSHADALARFLREAKLAIKIKSEHVARVMDVAQLEDGTPLVVMGYLQGGDLSQVIHQRGPLPVADAVDYVLQACQAVVEAHSLGIVHRDLKPANLFVTRRPDGTQCVEILDFGISKITLRDGVPMSMTSTQAVMGSPLYMSPEQMSSARNVDARADIWALGTILYEALSGQPPFDGETITQLVASILTTSPRPMRPGRVDVPTELEVVLSRCLEKDREQRWSSVAELALALAPFGPPGSDAIAVAFALLVISPASPDGEAPSSGAVQSAVALPTPSTPTAVTEPSATAAADASTVAPAASAVAEPPAATTERPPPASTR